MQASKGALYSPLKWYARSPSSRPSIVLSKFSAGKFRHLINPSDFIIRPRCPPLAEPLELPGVIDYANHGLTRNEVAAPRRHGCTSSGGMVDGEQPHDLAA